MTLKKKFKKNEYKQIVNYMSADKKNNDKKINLILLKKIGQTTKPNEYKISIVELKKAFNKII
jgi:3-dehydroquinate synthetase